MARSAGSAGALLFGESEDEGNEVRTKVRKEGVELSLVEKGKQAARAFGQVAWDVEKMSRVVIPVGRLIPLPGNDRLIPDMRAKQWELVPEDGSEVLVSRTTVKNGMDNGKEGEVVTGRQFVHRVYRRVAATRAILKNSEALAKEGEVALGEGAVAHLQTVAMAANFSSEKATLAEIAEAARLAVDVQTVDSNNPETRTWLNQMEQRGLMGVITGIGELAVRRNTVRELGEFIPDPEALMPVTDPKQDYIPGGHDKIVLFKQKGGRCFRAALLGAKGFDPLQLFGGVELLMDPHSGVISYQVGLESDVLAPSMKEVQLDLTINDGFENVGRVVTGKTRLNLRIGGVTIGDSRGSIARRIGGRLPETNRTNVIGKVKRSLGIGVPVDEKAARTKRKELLKLETADQKKIRLVNEENKRRIKEQNEERLLAESAMRGLPLVGTVTVRGKITAGYQQVVEIPVLDVPHVSATIGNMVGAVTEGEALIGESKGVVEGTLGRGITKLTDGEFSDVLVEHARSRIAESVSRPRVVVTEAKAMQQGMDGEIEQGILRSLGADPKGWNRGTKQYHLNSYNETGMRAAIRRKLGIPEGQREDYVDACIEVLRKHSR